MLGESASDRQVLPVSQNMASSFLQKHGSLFRPQVSRTPTVLHACLVVFQLFSLLSAIPCSTVVDMQTFGISLHLLELSL